MSISSEQAAQALRDVEQTSALSSTLYGYSQAAPHLLLWGCIWLVGFSLSDFFPSHAGLFWLVLDVVAIAGSTYFGVRTGRLSQRAKLTKINDTWRWLASVFAIMGFFVLVQIIMAPIVERQAVSLIALIVAAIYVVRGLWGSPRIGVTGIALAALTLFGFFEVRVHFDLWMAVMGGGSLILAGCWLRKA